MFGGLAIALVGMVFCLAVLGPLVRHVCAAAAAAAAAEAAARPHPAGHPALPALPAPAAIGRIAPAVGATRTTSVSDRMAPVPADDGTAMIDLARVEGRVQASAVRKVSEIVDKHPDEALSIVRSWMYQEH